MTPSVHILATCTNPDLIRATTLVFDTLRVGFPTTKVTVWLNRMQPEHAKLILPLADKVGSEVLPCDTAHPKWIAELIEREKEPFFICDTDVVFWKSFEQWDFSGNAMAGRYVPQFFDVWTKAVTRPRLHTSLLFLDPGLILKDLEKNRSLHPNNAFAPWPPMIYPLMIPWWPKTYFHDVCCLLYQTIGGHRFTTSALDCYDHLQAGTISDEIGKAYPGLSAEHAIFLDNPKLMRGLWRAHDNFYAAHAV